MPSPVSPDAGVPEHQPDQRRQNSRPWTGGQPRRTPNGPPQNGSRPQSGQFQSGPFPSTQARPGSGQFPSGGRPQSGPFPTTPDPSDQFAARPGSGPATTGDESGGRRTNSRRDWIWSTVAFLVAAGVIAAVGFHFFGPDATEEASATWAVDSCAGPDPTAVDAEAATDTYRPLPCDDTGATVTVLEIQDAVSVGQAHCPSGTDIIFQKDGHAGGTTQAVCARNLADDHPGDPGMGGGQLLTGDCVDKDGSEVACSSDGAHEVVGLAVGDSKCPEGTKDKIELGFDAQRSYETVCLGA